MTEYTSKCDACDKETNEAYEMPNGDYVCMSCYNEAIDRAEYNYQDMKENEVTGN